MHFGENQLYLSSIGISPLAHSSSPSFVTLVGSGFHEILLSLHPGHG